MILECQFFSALQDKGKLNTNNTYTGYPQRIEDEAEHFEMFVPKTHHLETDDKYEANYIEDELKKANAIMKT